MSRKNAAVYICGGEEFAGAANVALDRRDCPNERNHAPMPKAYGAWFAVAELRIKAEQSSEQCPSCGLYALARGGRSVPGWPRRTATVLREVAR